MINIINSLKRLERIGAEDSKTTKKMLDAAREVSSIIAELCGEDFSLRATVVDPDPEHRGPKGVWSGDYQVIHDPEQLLTPWILTCNGHDVAADRRVALMFSTDLSRGLLDAIAECIEFRTSDSEEALLILQGATETISSRKAG